jgi:hypothetical protein
MTYSITEAHADGRHASTHPEDRRFFVAGGCTECAEKFDANGMPRIDFVIEEADPEVGIFGDSIVHPCAANDEYAEATNDVTIRPDVSDPRMVQVITVFSCPACAETMTVIEQNPAEWFEEPGREAPMFEVVHEGIVTVYA